MKLFALFLAVVPAAVLGQGLGTNTPEAPLPLTWETCTSGGSCTQQSGAITLDSNWRWTHVVSF